MHNIKELKIWQKSIDLTIRVYEVSAKFPADERFGLVSQTRRCAVSVPSNVSEGAGRNTKGEFKQFLGIANGSYYELQTQLIIAARSGFMNELDTVELMDKIDELQKMNFKLQKALN